ncbi:MAG TPA: hypothetical protein GXZ95_02565 [Mollicutes bacterium]|nr:hypothetical protein [Mollicutes bacterium]
MTVQNKKTRTKTKTKSPTYKKTKSKGTKGKIKGKTERFKKTIKSNMLIIISFFTGVLLIIASYAWFSASLNVKIRFFDLTVSSDNGLFISLDAIDYSDSIEISVNSVISDLKKTYPNHTNQWSISGLWPVSTNGIRNSNSDKFDIYIGEMNRYRDREKHKEKFNKRYINTILVSEDEPNAFSSYIAFDFFLKNISGSPKNDNLYLDEGTFVDYDEELPDEIKESMSGIMNSIRFGFVKMASVSLKEDPKVVQNLKCNNQCEMFIYEPNYRTHSEESISKAGELGITLADGDYLPTYAVIAEGKYLEHANGHEGTGIPLDTEHFALQKTINDTDFEKPVFSIPNGITKMRAYVWIEGQDIDSLETYSKGAAIYVAINFIKDLAGYE